MRCPRATKEELTAPRSEFRVVGVDLKEASSANYLIGDFGTLRTAEEAAAERAAVGSPIYVYNDQGKLVVRYGSWH